MLESRRGSGFSETARRKLGRARQSHLTSPPSTNGSEHYEPRPRQVNSMISMEEVTVPSALTVRWNRMCCLPSDPSEPWTTTFSALVVVAFLAFTILLDDPARWPVKLAWLGSSGTKVTVPVVVMVIWTVPSPKSVVWSTPDNTIVSVPGAPEQGLCSARESVALKRMVWVWVAKAAVGASSAV